ncbi:MAG TPA: acyltransferase [bacterium]|nr:acyltransferase [bacterium]
MKDRKGPGRILLVDLLRSFAILTVMVHHLGFQYITAPASSPILDRLWYRLWINGGYGVTVFFVLSGYVITRLIAQGSRGLFDPDFREFYSRRAGRILPLLALTVLWGALFLAFPCPGHPYEYVFHHPGAVFSLPFWLSIPTFTFNWFKPLWPGASPDYGLHWDILWSLSVEEQFYFAYPFLLKKLGNEKRLKAFLLMLIFFPPVFMAARTFYFPHVEVPILGGLAPFGAIATGCLLELASRRFGPALERHKGVSVLTTLAGLSLFLAAFLHQDYKADFWGHIVGSPSITWGVFLFLLGGFHLDLFRWPIWKPLALPGILCYGGYLLHPLFLFLFWPLISGMDGFLAYALYAGATLALAYLSYRFFEVPANRWVRGLLGARRS